MIRSMTGFARVTREVECGELTLEIRSVNHRYLDLKLGLPDALRSLEEGLRARLRSTLTRGRVEAALRWRARAADGFSVNRALADALVGTARELAAQTGTEPNLDAMALLTWPGVIETPALRLDALEPDFDALCAATLEALVAAREREGRALSEALAQRLRRLETQARDLRARTPARAEDLRARLAQRLEPLGEAVDGARVAQEAALLVLRQDVSEELDRLLAHVAEAERLLDAEEPVGRRLDFLMQELAREANTLASKAGDLDTNRRALDFKVLVEEMREQVQNVE